jgi:hypothetical protein
MTGVLDVLESITATYIPGDSGGTIYTQTREDFIIVADGGALRGVFRRADLADALSVADEVLLSRLRGIVVQDDVTLLDALLGSLVRVNVNSDDVTVLDFTLVSRLRNIAFTDLFTVIDSFEATVFGGMVNFVTTTDTILVIDNEETVRTFNVTATASIDVVDSFIAQVFSPSGTIYAQTIQDVVVLTDGFVRVFLHARTLVDLLTLTDPTTSTREIEVAVSEDIEVTDQTIRSLLFQRVSSDGLTLLDFIIGGGTGVTSVTLSEFVAFADEALWSIERNRLLADTASFSDELALSIARLATLTESVTIQDGNLNIFLRNTRITEDVTVTDEVLTSLLLAVLYNVRVFIGHAVDVRLSWVRGPELGAYA